MQSDREARVKIKFNPVKGVLKGKRVVVVEDSIVRGTTLKQLMKLIRTAEPTEVHLRISSPPIIAPCFYGMDFPTKEELIAKARNEAEELFPKLSSYPLLVEKLKEVTSEKVSAD